MSQHDTTDTNNPAETAETADMDQYTLRTLQERTGTQAVQDYLVTLWPYGVDEEPLVFAVVARDADEAAVMAANEVRDVMAANEVRDVSATAYQVDLESDPWRSVDAQGQVYGTEAGIAYRPMKDQQVAKAFYGTQAEPRCRGLDTEAFMARCNKLDGFDHADPMLALEALLARWQ